MELREFAERVLFATTLEEKLRPAPSITDERPGPPRATPPAPGRPQGLAFKPRCSPPAAFPGARQLERARERGRLLHFFANHELLATELMALALLRFPDAPTAFRRGLLQTLQDEQEHTRLYLRRMQECGVEFGELPVSGYFWRAVSAMASPLDYVARLSLTFEQANLDYASQFAAEFSKLGDAATAELLTRIYRDEIAHVAYGLKWFRRWKAPELNDWEAFCRQLQFPLSPSRAKGAAVVLNVSGRRAAGFGNDFIDELALHAQSRGRTPDVFLFNPLEEARVARGSSCTPVKAQEQLARDLNHLPQFLCRQDDVVLVENRPSAAFLSRIQQAGIPLPEFVELNRSPATGPGDAALTALAARKIGRLRPWAWGPGSVERLAPLLAVAHDWPCRAGESFPPAWRTLYSKAWSARLLRRILERQAVPWLCGAQEIGVEVHSLDEALAAIGAIRARGHQRVVVKEAIGLAGRNAVRLWEPELLASQRRWLERSLAGGQALVVEPWLERLIDFSIQLEMGRRGLGVCGYTGLLNDRRGQFQANWAAPQYRQRFPAPVSALLNQGWSPGPIPNSAPPRPATRGRGLFPDALHTLFAEIWLLLEEELGQAGFLGPLNIDAFVYRAADGLPRLKPIVEMNPRYTMGRVTVELMSHAGPGSHGVFRLINQAIARAEGFSSLEAWARSRQERFPLRFAGSPKPQIVEGVLCLNDPVEAQACLAVFEVSRHAPAWGCEPIGKLKTETG